MPDSISRRSFLKSVASLAAAVGFFPGNLLSVGCSGDSANGKSGPRGYLFPLTKGPLMDNGATPWYATVFSWDTRSDHHGYDGYRNHEHLGYLLFMLN